MTLSPSAAKTLFQLSICGLITDKSSPKFIPNSKLFLFFNALLYRESFFKCTGVCIIATLSRYSRLHSGTPLMRFKCSGIKTTYFNTPYNSKADFIASPLYFISFLLLQIVNSIRFSLSVLNEVVNHILITHFSLELSKEKGI